MSILLYGCTTWMMTKCIEKKLDSCCTRMLWAILNKSLMEHPTKQQLLGLQLSISKTIQIWYGRHVGHCCRSKDEIISDVLLWSPSHGRASIGRSASTYLQLLCTDKGCSLEDLLEAMDDRDRWRERVKEIRISSTTCCWWWWWWHHHIQDGITESKLYLESKLMCFMTIIEKYSTEYVFA